METQTNMDGAILKEFGYARALIDKILDRYPRTRDMEDDRFKQFVMAYCEIYEMDPPKTETIRRTRQKIQNSEGKYPASDEVQTIRKLRQEAIEQNLKYI